MIDQILIGSCEHQRYRRAAQLAVLELLGYPLHIIDVVWGFHADYHDSSAYHNILEAMNIPVHQKEKQRYRYTQSNVAVKAEILSRIIASGKNTMMVEDDHVLKTPYTDLCDKINGLDISIKSKLGVINFYPRGSRYAAAPPIVCIEGAEDFEQGCWANGHHMVFITPYGAKQLLEFLREPSTPCSIEHGWKFLGNKDWIYSVVPAQRSCFVQELRCIQSDSIGTRLTQSGEDVRRTSEQIAQDYHIIRHFRL